MFQFKIGCVPSFHLQHILNTVKTGQERGAERDKGEDMRQRARLEPGPAVLSCIACGRPLSALS